MDNQTLKPCPVCRGTSLNTEAAFINEKQQICCERYDCGVRGPIGQSYAHAVNLWNALPRSSDTESSKLSERDVLRAQMAASIFGSLFAKRTEFLFDADKQCIIIGTNPSPGSLRDVALSEADVLLALIETDRAAAVTDTKEKEQL